MKHTLNITVLLILFFIISQLFGLLVLEKYMVREEGKLSYDELPFGVERPEMDHDMSFLFIIGGVLVGTAILFLIIYFKKVLLWKIWYYIAIVIAITFALKPFFNEYLSLAFAIIFAYFKSKDQMIYNLSEIIIYGGLAAIFVPIMSLYSASLMLILISIYDIIAVWKSKHMVKLAEFQSKNSLFAGLYFPYTKKRGIVSKIKDAHSKVGNKGTKKSSKTIGRIAILGGGDIAFPLIFAGVVMAHLIENGITSAFLYTTIIVATTTVALSLLFFKAKEKRFYPAMPFISLGAFIGYGIILLIL